MTEDSKKSVYNREVQLKYNQGRLQMSFRFAKGDKDIELATRQYMSDHDLSSGSMARIAVIEKLEREGYLNDHEKND